MGRYLLRRLLIAVPTLIGISIVSFTIISLAPGDVASALISPDEGGAAATASQAGLRRQYGLDDPLPVRYWHWLSHVTRGDFGASVVDHRPVSAILKTSASLTLQITVPALFIGLLLAVLVGLWSGSRPYSRLDDALSLVSVVIAGLPGFVIAILLLYLFGVRLGLLPTGGSKGIATAHDSLITRAKYFVLPVATLSVVTASHLVRYIRDSVINVRAADYIQTARAKGLSDAAVRNRHIMRNALLPVITVAALQIPALINGALLVETVFGWGGLGSRVATAIGQRDFPVIMGASLATGVAVIIANFVADLLYAVADPRIRLR